MSVASLRVGTPLGFDQRRHTWAGARGVWGEMAQWVAGTVGARLARAHRHTRKGEKCKRFFVYFFVCLMQAIH